MAIPMQIIIALPTYMRRFKFVASFIVTFNKFTMYFKVENSCKSEFQIVVPHSKIHQITNHKVYILLPRLDLLSFKKFQGKWFNILIDTII